jgi:hypothetical protein
MCVWSGLPFQFDRVRSFRQVFVARWNLIAPRLSQDELWAGVCNLKGQRIPSLTGTSFHRVASVDDKQKRYEVEYASGNTAVVS